MRGMMWDMSCKCLPSGKSIPTSTFDTSMNVWIEYLGSLVRSLAPSRNRIREPDPAQPLYSLLAAALLVGSIWI